MSALISSFSFSRAALREQALGGNALMQSLSVCNIKLPLPHIGDYPLIASLSVNHLVEQEPARADVSKVLIAEISYSKDEQTADMTTRIVETI